MQDIDFSWFQDLLDELLGIGWFIVGYAWGLLPFQSDHSLGIFEWFILALLSGVLVFIWKYGDGIILDTIAEAVSQTKPHTKQFVRDVQRFTKTTYRKGKPKARRRRD